MHNSIVVYRIMSENSDIGDMNTSYQTAMELTAMGVVESSHDDYEVIREGNTTVTVYSFRRVV